LAGSTHDGSLGSARSSCSEGSLGAGRTRVSRSLHDSRPQSFPALMFADRPLGYIGDSERDRPNRKATTGRRSFCKVLVWTATARALELRRIFCVTTHFRNGAETISKAVQEFAMEHRLRGRQFVEVPQTILSSRHQPCFAKTSEVTGGSWLGNAQNRHQIADAQFSIPQQV
jgi:hypothetical protein